MRVEYEKPLDTAEQIFMSGRTVYLKKFYKNYLKDSVNSWHNRLAKKAEEYRNGNLAKVLKEIAKTGVGVTPAWYIDYAYMVATSRDDATTCRSCGPAASSKVAIGVRLNLLHLLPPVFPDHTRTPKEIPRQPFQPTPE